MSWTVGRETTREEDKAYSLMGLFGVNMPLLYSEGARAIIRLQEEIMRTTYDHSLFAWRYPWAGINLSAPSINPSLFTWRNDSAYRGLLAPSINHFRGCGDIISVDYATYDAQFSQFRKAQKEPMPHFSQTNYGTQIELPLQAHMATTGFYKAYLACTLMRRYPPKFQNDFLYVKLRHRPSAGTDSYERFETFEFPNDLWGLIDTQIETKRIFVATMDPSVFGFKDMTISHMRDISFKTPMEVEFKIGPPSFFHDRASKGIRLVYSPEYYCSGPIRKDFSRPEYVLNFAPTNNNAFLALRLGSATFWNTKDEQGKVVGSTFNFIVLCGIHDGALWTDVLIDTRTGYSGEAYTLYEPGTDVGRAARLAARPSTKRTIRQVFSPKIEELSSSLTTRMLKTKYAVPNASLQIEVTRRRRTDAHWSCDAVFKFQWSEDMIDNDTALVSRVEKKDDDWVRKL